MGVLPLEFPRGITRNTLGISGKEIFDVIGDPKPGGELKLFIKSPSDKPKEVSLISRIDTEEELLIYKAGGVLQRFAQDFLEEGAN